MEEIKKEFYEITKQLFIGKICDECSGTGEDFEDSSKKCGECSGTGMVKKLNPALWQFIEQKLTEAIKQAKIEENEMWNGKFHLPTNIDFENRINQLKGDKYGKKLC